MEPRRWLDHLLHWWYGGRLQSFESRNLPIYSSAFGHVGGETTCRYTIHALNI